MDGVHLIKLTLDEETALLQSFRLHPDDPLFSVPCHFTMQLTNEQAGAVLGVKGANISAIIKMSGAKVSIQGRAEVAEGGLRELDIHVCNASVSCLKLCARSTLVGQSLFLRLCFARHHTGH
jgi:hypothetical protein